MSLSTPYGMEIGGGSGRVGGGRRILRKNIITGIQTSVN